MTVNTEPITPRKRLDRYKPQVLRLRRLFDDCKGDPKWWARQERPRSGKSVGSNESRARWFDWSPAGIFHQGRKPQQQLQQSPDVWLQSDPHLPSSKTALQDGSDHV